MSVESDARETPLAPAKRGDNKLGTAYSSPATRRLAWVLRALILASGIYQTFFGETDIGIITLVCLAVIVAPAFFTRGLINFFPIEIEIILFGWSSFSTFWAKRATCIRPFRTTTSLCTPCCRAWSG
jgi:hypothetical protein